MPPSDPVPASSAVFPPWSALPAFGERADERGESDWFSAEVKCHEPALRAYLRNRFPSLSDHDDVVQESYSRLLRARESGRPLFAKAFLFTVARNVAIDMFRRRRVVPHETLSESDELPALEETPGVADALDHQERHELLLEAVGALPERCRQVMLLRHRDGLSYKEIAARLGIAPGTVKLHMVKGVRDCIAFFRQHGMLDDDSDGLREPGGLP